MSFILDALKKSESDRQRQSGPALFEVRIAPPKVRFPLWAVALVLLLGVNAVIVGWLLLRHASRAQEPPAAAATPAHIAATPSAVAPAISPPGAATAASTGAAHAAAQAAPSAAPLAAAAAPVASAEHSAGAKQEPTLSGAQQGAGDGESGAPTSTGNPDDYAPATDALPMPGLKGHVRRGTESGYPLYQDAALAPGANLPQLRLDLHVYAPRPQDRFALINMHKLREGDSLPESGVKVEEIIPEGVVMSHNGARFLLPRD